MSKSRVACILLLLCSLGIAACGGGGGNRDKLSNPQPSITSLSPSSVAAGAPGVTLTVNGANFIASSVVRWNGGDRPTAFLNAAQLQASIPTSDVTTAGSAQVTVYAPASGSGLSNAVTFTINAPTFNITALTPSSATAGGAGFNLKVNGNGFVLDSVVQWKGSSRPTTFVSSTELTASIAAPDIASGGTAVVTVRDASPGGGTSAGVPFTITAPPSNWVFVGAPFSDSGVEQIVVDAQDSRILYVAATNALYGSRDGGASWAILVPTLVYTGVIAPDPNNVNRVFYGQSHYNTSRLYVSTDRGVTWDEVAFLNSGRFRSLLVSGVDPHTIFIGFQGGQGVFYRSTDDGVSWQSYSFGYQPSANILPWVIAEDRLDGMLYVGVELADHPQPYHPPFFRSSDRGMTWENVAGTGPPSPGALWWHVISIAVHPTNHKVFALQEGGGLYTSLDHGLSWTQAPHAVAFTCGLVMDPNMENRFFGGWVFWSEFPGGALISTDGAETFMPFGLEKRTVCSLAPSGDSKFLYAAAYGSGIYVTPLP